MTRVLVCGGRDFVMTDHWANRLHDAFGRYGATSVIHGGASGADIHAGRIAMGRGLPVEAFYADWKKHGKAAGPIRNQRMIDEGKPCVVLWLPGGRGTADMMRRAQIAGILTIQV